MSTTSLFANYQPFNASFYRMKNGLLATLLLLSVAASAQFNIGLQAGGQSSNVRFATGTLSPIGFNTDALLGFHLGAFLDVPLGKKAAFRPQIMYMGKGFKTSVSGLGSENVTVGYLHIPAELLFRSEAGEGEGFFGIGGYYSTALGGKAGSESLKFGTATTDDLREADYGLRASVGYQTEFGIGFVVFYEYGLANINPTDAYTANNRTFGLSLQYSFLR
jgi:hypothetical protein